MKKVLVLSFMFLFFLTGCDAHNDCDKDLLESVTSPDGKHTINTYLVNCGATIDWSVEANLCDENDNCKKIYNCYHENASSVEWIDNETININNKILNIYKDKYDWRKDDDYRSKLNKKKPLVD